MLATFVVDTLADSVDPEDGLTSLREAVQLANDRGGEDRITFAGAVTYAQAVRQALSSAGVEIATMGSFI